MSLVSAIAAVLIVLLSPVISATPSMPLQLTATIVPSAWFFQQFNDDPGAFPTLRLLFAAHQASTTEMPANDFSSRGGSIAPGNDSADGASNGSTMQSNATSSENGHRL